MKQKLSLTMLVSYLLLLMLPTGIFASEPAEEADLVISTVEELIAFRDRVNSGENRYPGQTIVLAADLDLSDVTWKWIGTSTNSFCGTFDGGGHEISGLTSDNGGLFGYVGGTVGGISSGGITIGGTRYYGVIKNLGVSGNISGGETGGIVGRLNFGTVENCYSNCTVTGGGSTAGRGGIAGYCGNDGTVINCYNTGNVSGNTSYIGGIVGQNNGTVINCYNAGSVSGSATSIGSVVGTNSTVTNCYYLSDGSMSDNYATGLTAEEMKLQSSYAGFDFDTVWGISPDINNGLPYLRVFAADVPADGLTAEFASAPSYDSENGTYNFGISVKNGTSGAVSTNVYAAAYDADGRLTGVYMQALTELASGSSSELSAAITAAETASEIKIICMGADMVPDLTKASLYSFNNSPEQ